MMCGTMPVVFFVLDDWCHAIETYCQLPSLLPKVGIVVTVFVAAVHFKLVLVIVGDSLVLCG